MVYDTEPTEAPRNLTLHDLRDATTALLGWEPVSEDSIRGHFKGYKVWYNAVCVCVYLPTQGLSYTRVALSP